MSTIAILGAGETGATLARRLAETERFAAIWLVDEDEGRARGKALDLAQSGPVEGYDTESRGTGRLDKLPELTALVVAETKEIAKAAADASSVSRFSPTRRAAYSWILARADCSAPGETS